MEQYAYFLNLFIYSARNKTDITSRTYCIRQNIRYISIDES